MAEYVAEYVAAGQTATHRAQPVMRSLARYQLVSRDDTTTGARERRMGSGVQEQQQAVREGPDWPQRYSK